ncbi:MAG: CBS domain-containing protein [Rhodospirillales bacterium]|nr:CBS domain-containing protein [Rhodospirillales bacterium]
MIAKDIMTAQVITVSPATPVTKIAKLLSNSHISGVPVIDDDGKLVGMVSEGDLLGNGANGDHRRAWWLAWLAGGNGHNDAFKKFADKFAGKTASDMMSKDVRTVDYFYPVPRIAEILEKHRIKRVPVVDKGQLVGIISRANLVQAMAAEIDQSDKDTEADRAIREDLINYIADKGITHSPLMNVLVSGGVATYWGLVDSEETQSALVDAAENMPGVTSVIDHLGVATLLDLEPA